MSLPFTFGTTMLKFTFLQIPLFFTVCQAVFKLIFTTQSSCTSVVYTTSHTNHLRGTKCGKILSVKGIYLVTILFNGLPAILT